MKKLLMIMIFVVALIIGCSRSYRGAGKVDITSHYLLRPVYGSGGAHYKVGKPYEIDGKYYYPRINNKYDEIGIASWYGDKFHGKLTANMETYNQYDLTAAHKTLPIPSMVEVTNLENGRKVIVRINDRGPFVSSRVIDLSRAAAEKINMINSGTVRVRVRYLPAETDTLHRIILGSPKNR